MQHGYPRGRKPAAKRSSQRHPHAAARKSHKALIRALRVGLPTAMAHVLGVRKAR